MRGILGSIFCLASCLSTVSLAQVSSPTAREPEITAAGRGETHIAPTFGVVMIAVTTRAGTAAEAASQNAAKVASTLAAIREAGVAPEDLTNQGYSLEQAYDDNGRRRGGFTARNAIRAQVNRIDQIGRVLDAAIAGGATDISSIQFGSANIEEARRSAMIQAVKQARADAALIATAAGGSLGRLISLTSSGGAPPVYGQFQLESAVSTSGGGPVPTSISPRDLIATAQASGRWEFVPGPAR